MLAIYPSLAQPQESSAKPVFEKICGTCHETKEVTMRRRTKTGWEQVVEDMMARGAEGSEEDLAAIVSYLAVNYGRVNVNTASADSMQQTLGLSAKDAQAIVAYRGKNGRIADFDELLKVPGIDADRVREKRPLIAFAD
jgi:competence ComEA-like helix-hairpin-helix protein